MTKKRFDNVSDMMQGISDDASFNEEFEGHLRSRQVVKSLVVMRAAHGLSQSDIAEELGCAQGTVSRIENGCDADLTLEVLAAYGKATGNEFQLLIVKRDESLAGLVKHHALSMREALLMLVELAHKDADIAEGVANFHIEAMFNLVRIMQETSNNLPPCPDNGEPYIQILGMKEVEMPRERNEEDPDGIVPFEPAVKG